MFWKVSKLLISFVVIKSNQ